MILVDKTWFLIFLLNFWLKSILNCSTKSEALDVHILCNFILENIDWNVVLREEIHWNTFKCYGLMNFQYFFLWKNRYDDEVIEFRLNNWLNISHICSIVLQINLDRGIFQSIIFSFSPFCLHFSFVKSTENWDSLSVQYSVSKLRIVYI